MIAALLLLIGCASRPAWEGEVQRIIGDPVPVSLYPFYNEPEYATYDQMSASGWMHVPGQGSLLIRCDLLMTINVGFDVGDVLPIRTWGEGNRDEDYVTLGWYEQDVNGEQVFRKSADSSDPVEGTFQVTDSDGSTFLIANLDARIEEDRVIDLTVNWGPF